LFGLDKLPCSPPSAFIFGVSPLQAGIEVSAIQAFDIHFGIVTVGVGHMHLLEVPAARQQ